MKNGDFKQIKINRLNPNNVSPIHVNDLIVNTDGKEFFLNFLEIEPPVFLEPEELMNIESIDAITRVKLVISPDFAEAVAKALVENIEKFKLVGKLPRE